MNANILISKKQVLTWIYLAADRMQQHKIQLTELDSEIGDADHGINMERGFNKVLSMLPAVEEKDIGTILKTTGMALISSVGGASGPLYGTFFLEAAKSCAEKESLDLADLMLLFQNGINGIKRIGKANIGDKTILDTLIPALDAMQKIQNDNLANEDPLLFVCISAKKGMESTIPLVARKGRASYLGERSAGHQDPGATSTFYLIEALHQAALQQ